MALFGISFLVFLTTIGLTVSAAYFFIHVPASRKQMRTRLRSIQEAAVAAPSAGTIQRIEGLSGAAPFADPNFYLGLFQSFAPGPGNDEIVVVDEETAAVARIADDRAIPFIAFRALSDSSTADHGGDPLMLPGFPVTFFFYAQLAADNAAAVALEFLARWNP